MAKILTEDGFYDSEKKAVLNVDGEDFKVEDFDLGHPPSKQAKVHYEEPTDPKPKRFFNKQQSNEDVMPREERREAVRNWNSDPRVKANGLVAVEKGKMIIYGVGILLFLALLGLGIFLLNSRLSDFNNKDLNNNINVEGSETNNTYDFTVSPTINNDHTIINEVNVTIELPSFNSENTTEEVANSISNKVIEGIKPLIEELVQNVTNSTS